MFNMSKFSRGTVEVNHILLLPTNNNKYNKSLNEDQINLQNNCKYVINA